MIATIKAEQLEAMGVLLDATQSLRTEVTVGVSGRHLHVCQEHVEILFGKGHSLTPIRGLSQPGQFACEEQVNLRSAKGEIQNVRVLGPVRPETQVELSLTDTFRLKLDVSVPVRMSGKTEGSPGLTLVGPAGEVELERGVIIAQRHIHMTPEDAAAFGLTDKQMVAVACGDARQVVFGNVVVRVSNEYSLDFHIDTDEANAAGVKTGDKGYLVRPTLSYQLPITNLLG